MYFANLYTQKQLDRFRLKFKIVLSDTYQENLESNLYHVRKYP